MRQAFAALDGSSREFEVARDAASSVTMRIQAPDAQSDADLRTLHLVIWSSGTLQVHATRPIAVTSDKAHDETIPEGYQTFTRKGPSQAESFLETLDLESPRFSVLGRIHGRPDQR